MYIETYNNDLLNRTIDVFTVPRDVMLVQLTVFLLSFGFIFYMLFLTLFEMNKSNVVIVRGMPGSGKSSWVSEQIKTHPNSICISMDDFVFDDGDTLRKAHVKTLDVLLYLLKKNKYTTIFVEGIFSRYWEYETIETLSNLYDYDVKLVELVGPHDFKQMCARSQYNSDIWDMRWFEFLRDNWEVDHRSRFIDLEYASASASETIESSEEDASETSETSSDNRENIYNWVKRGSRRRRYNLRPRK